MAELNKNVTILLDRLYNLKGEDNVLIREDEERIEEAISQIASIEKTIDGAKSEQQQQERDLNTFLQQKSIFESAFADLTNETFSALTKIDVNFEIGTLMTQVQTNSPIYIKETTDIIERIKNDIANYEIEKEEVGNELIEQRNILKVHQEQRKQLVSLLEQSLSPKEIERESLTTNFVKRVLSSFDVFTVDEISKLTKIIIFPDDGLYEYDQTYKTRLANGLIGYVEEENDLETELDTNLTSESETITKEDTFEEMPLSETSDIPSVVNENGQIKLDISKLTTQDEVEDEKKRNELAEIEQEMQDLLEEITASGEKTEKQKEDDKKQDNLAQIEQEMQELLDEINASGNNTNIVEDDNTITEKKDVLSGEEKFINEAIEENFDSTRVEEFLKIVGLDINNFQKINDVSLNVILKEIASVDESIIKENYEILRSINLDDEAYKMRLGHMYITDRDFNKKITLLRAKNISESKIKLMVKDPNSGLKIMFNDFEKRIQAVENLHGKLDESNIYLICKDITKYEENVDTLLRYGIDIDDKESRNHTAILFESLNIPANVEILKNYIISILKSNGKYALSVFWKKPEELLNDIDSLIEAGLENVIATHPEILGVTASSILKRVRYCVINNQPIFNDDMRSEPCDYILKNDVFKQKLGAQNNMPSLGLTNNKLLELIGNPDYVEILLNTLEDYYDKTETYITPEINETMIDTYEKLCHYLEDNAKAHLTGKYTYEVDGVCVCKNKIERNIAIILNALAKSNQSIDGVEKEIALVSALYNSSLSDEEIKKVVGSCLGFNQAAQEVKL